MNNNEDENGSEFEKKAGHKKIKQDSFQSHNDTTEDSGSIPALHIGNTG
jgi:hypothetical protein